MSRLMPQHNRDECSAARYVFRMVPPDGRRFTIGVAAVLVVALGIAYANSFTVGFHFDDAYVVAENPAIRSFRSLPRWFYDPFTSTTVRENVDLRPIPLITFAANYTISGLSPWSWRAVNLL